MIWLSDFCVFTSLSRVPQRTNQLVTNLFSKLLYPSRDAIVEYHHGTQQNGSWEEKVDATFDYRIRAWKLWNVDIYDVEARGINGGNAHK